MSVKNAAPIIIKRKKVVKADGHHGGAWKVAYADFVTAMMAFFMLLWLLNATTEKQRKGIADYFSPTIPIVRVSGGGDGALGGDSVFTDQTLSQSGTPADDAQGLPDSEKDGKTEMDGRTFAEIEEILKGRGGESSVSDDLLAHIVTRVTDEGLIVELFDLPDAPLFDPAGDDLTDLGTALIEMATGVFALVVNEVAIGDHVASQPIVLALNDTWPRSGRRAASVRDALLAAEFPADRIRRLTAHADREHVSPNPLSVRNNRIELTLLRSDN